MKPPIFLFSSGRCGSTLVQRALNAHRNVIVFGEHEGFLGPVARSYYQLTESEFLERMVFAESAVPAEVVFGELQDLRANIAWVNTFRREDLIPQYREFVLGMLARGVDLDEIHWGFKEIRYRSAPKESRDPQGGDRVLEMLYDLFEGARFVVLVRHPVDTVVSMLLAWCRWMAELGLDDQLAETARGRLDAWLLTYRYLLRFCHSRPEASRIILYEEFVDAPERELASLFGDLGLETPPLALDVCRRGVSVTREDPLRDRMVALVEDCVESSREELEPMVAELGYQQQLP